MTPHIRIPAHAVIPAVLVDFPAWKKVYRAECLCGQVASYRLYARDAERAVLGHVMARAKAKS